MRFEAAEESIRTELAREPGLDPEFPSRVMEQIRNVRDGRTDREEQPEVIWGGVGGRRPSRGAGLGLGPRSIFGVAAAAVILLVAGVWAGSHFSSGSEGSGPAGSVGGVALAPAEVLGADSDLEVLDVSEVGVEGSGADRGKRVFRLRQTLGRLIELQGKDGAWSIEAGELPLDQVGLSALAFKTFVKLGGREKYPVKAERALSYLRRRQREDGSFSPSLLTTAVVVDVLDDVGAGEDGQGAMSEYVSRGKRFLRRHRNAVGTWSSHTGNERDDLLATVFAARAVGDEGKFREAMSFLRRKTESLLREARNDDSADLNTRLALCLAARVSLGVEPGEPEIQDAARVLFGRLGGRSNQASPMDRFLAADPGAEYWGWLGESMVQEDEALSRGETGFGILEVLSLALLQDGRG